MRDLRAATDDELLCWTPRHPRAFDEFYVRHEAVVLVYFRRRTDSSDVALDLAAETFVRALAGVRRYKPGREPAIAWVLGIARHVLIDSLRRGRVADRARARMGAPVLALDDEELERIDALGRRSAESLLANLPVEQAAAVKARVLEELPYEDIGSRLQCSPLVARKRVSRGLATLRSLVLEDAE